MSKVVVYHTLVAVTVLAFLFIAVQAVSIFNSFEQVAKINQAAEVQDSRVVLGHRVDSNGNFQLVYKN